MIRIFLISLLALPLIEIATFIKVGQWFGLLPTLLGVVVAAIAGMLVIKAQGLSLMSQMQATMGRGQLPARSIADAMFVFLAGVLLLIPGYFTDLVAILLLIPAVRGAIYEFLRSRMTVMATASAGMGEAPQPQVRARGVIDLDQDDYRAR